MQFTLDPKPTKDTQVDQHHNQRSSDSNRPPQRRHAGRKRPS